MMKMWYREPLLHFLLTGGLIFGLFGLVSDDRGYERKNRIEVTAAEIERLSAGWSTKWRRPPTEGELQGLIDSYIREEVYYREALALGLDQDDTILRRRLVQKMEFLSNDLAELKTPDDVELRRYYLDNQEEYRIPARVSFTHVYFNRDRRGEQAEHDAERVLAGLRDMQETSHQAWQAGDPFMFQYDFSIQSLREVSRMFGGSFAEELFKLKRHSWTGPVESGYGLHLVKIDEMIDSRLPEFADVQDKVRTDLMFEQRQKMNREIYERFKERYEIVVEDMPKQSGMAGTVKRDRGTS